MLLNTVRCQLPEQLTCTRQQDAEASRGSCLAAAVSALAHAVVTLQKDTSASAHMLCSLLQTMQDVNVCQPTHRRVLLTVHTWGVDVLKETRDNEAGSLEGKYRRREQQGKQMRDRKMERNKKLNNKKIYLIYYAQKGLKRLRRMWWGRRAKQPTQRSALQLRPAPAWRRTPPTRSSA